MMANCPAVTNPVYEPTRTIISSITNTDPIEVTTSADHNYATGLIVRLLVQTRYGMPQARYLVGSITVTGDTTFTLPFDGTQWDSFVVPAVTEQCSQVIPVGNDNDKSNLATHNVL